MSDSTGVLFNQFVNGASIETAANIFDEGQRKDSKLIASLITAAVIPRKVIVDKKVSVILVGRGYSVGSDLNYSLARIVGNMILEANEFSFKSRIEKKIGGRSMFSATKLTGKAKEINDEQRANGFFDDMNKYKTNFMIKAAVVADVEKELS